MADLRSFEQIFFQGEKREIDMDSLIKACPSGFKEDGNLWVNYAAKCMGGVNTLHWKWKLPEGVARPRSQFHFFKALHMPGYKMQNIWVAGWMLSNMLETVPE